MDERIRSYEPLVQRVAKYFYRRSERIPLDDLAQEARIAVWEALRKWDGRGTEARYVRYIVAFRVKNFLASEVRQRVDIGNFDRRESREPSNPGAEARVDELRLTLKPRTFSILCRLADGLTMKEAAGEHGISHHAGKQVLSRLRKKYA